MYSLIYNIKTYCPHQSKTIPWAHIEKGKTGNVMIIGKLKGKEVQNDTRREDGRQLI